jgi:hypothetical protein
LPEALALRLVDHEEDVAVDLLHAGEGAGTYRLLSHGPDRPYRLGLLVGTEDYVTRTQSALVDIPKRCTLDPSSPNPFNGGTRIRFGLPRPARVTLQVHDARGARVAVLLDHAPLPAGYHAMLWDGRASSGRPAASGVYFYRLVTGDTQITRRCVLLK